MLSSQLTHFKVYLPPSAYFLQVTFKLCYLAIAAIVSLTFGHPVFSFQSGVGKYQMSVVPVRLKGLAEWAINWPKEFNGANPVEQTL